MNSKFCKLLEELLKEYDKIVYKQKNYTKTYDMQYLEKFILTVREWTINNHARKISLGELDELVDKMAEELEEYRAHQQPWRWYKKRDRL